jgi:hypothetical protein
MPGSSVSAREGTYNQRAYRRARANLLEQRPPCAYCGAEATEADHQPPLSLHDHVAGSDCCLLVPSCGPCGRSQGASIRNAGAAPRSRAVKIEEPSPVAFERFGVPWLEDLIDVPVDATWPRLMTAPHPRAVGSHGTLLEAWSLERRGRPLRWWQRLYARRLLEHDDAGALVWVVSVLTVARQVGKTYVLGDACGWRLESGEELLGGEQLVLSTGKDVAVVREMQRPHRLRAKRDPSRYHVREVNGQEEIELLADGSRWMVRAKEGVYGVSATMATVDEGWKVLASVVDDGIEPTTVEAEDAQILLVSTAHRRATALMVGRRARALENLETGDGPLLVEWSAPPDAELDDRAAWRLASPHWTPKRERLIAQRLEGALAGESDDVDEPDPLTSFRTQWLNQWPAKRLKVTKGEPLVELEAWLELRGDVVDDRERIFLAVEDHAGLGAAISAVVPQADGRLGLDGWTVSSWSEALVDLRRLIASHELVTLVAGASLLVRLPRGMRAHGATSTITRSSLPLMRELVAAGAIVHDSAELEEQVDTVRVEEAIGGLRVVAGIRSDLLRSASWALAHAHRPRRVPSVR